MENEKTMRGGTGRRKIEIKRREKASDRMVTFSKRRKGLFKKVRELYSKTDAKAAAVVVFSPAGKPYTHGEPSFDSVLSDYFKMMGHPDEIMNGHNNGRARSDDTGEAAAGVDRNPAKQWLDSLQVDECESLEEVTALLNKLEEIASEAENRHFFLSLLA